MNQKLVPFNFESQKVRVVSEHGEPWFVAADVCAVLGIANARDAVSLLDDDEKGVAITDTLGGRQQFNTVSESGLYALTFKSRKPQAKRFRKWVTHEVLPSIRKTGRYQPHFPVQPDVNRVDNATMEIYVDEYIALLQLKIKSLEKHITRHNNPLRPDEINNIRIWKRDGIGTKEIAGMLRCSRTTVRKYARII